MEPQEVSVASSPMETVTESKVTGKVKIWTGRGGRQAKRPAPRFLTGRKRETMPRKKEMNRTAAVALARVLSLLYNGF